MKDYIMQRVKDAATIVVTNNKTIRQTAKIQNVSKSTTYLDLTKRLPSIDINQATTVQKILDKHFAVKHLKGGEATKLHYHKLYEIKL